MSFTLMTDKCPCVVAYVTAVQCCVSGLTYGYELLGAGVWKIKAGMKIIIIIKR